MESSSRSYVKPCVTSTDSTDSISTDYTASTSTDSTGSTSSMCNLYRLLICLLTVLFPSFFKNVSLMWHHDFWLVFISDWISYFSPTINLYQVTYGFNYDYGLITIKNILCNHFQVSSNKTQCTVACLPNNITLVQIISVIITLIFIYRHASTSHNSNRCYNDSNSFYNLLVNGFENCLDMDRFTDMDIPGIA